MCDTNTNELDEERKRELVENYPNLSGYTKYNGEIKVDAHGFKNENGVIKDPEVRFGPERAEYIEEVLGPITDPDATVAIFETPEEDCNIAIREYVPKMFGGLDNKPIPASGCNGEVDINKSREEDRFVITWKMETVFGYKCTSIPGSRVEAILKKDDGKYRLVNWPDFERFAKLRLPEKNAIMLR